MHTRTSRPRRAWRAAIIGLLLSLLAIPAVVAQPEAAGERSVLLLDIKGGIGPATTDYLRRGIERAGEEDAAAVVLRIDTPGGLDAATRDINQAILASRVPVIAYVAPNGARAASAGTYIVYASHLAAMAPATSLGAATPVSIGGTPGPGREPEQAPAQDDKAPAEQDQEAGNGDEPKEDSSSGQGATAMERKALNDSVAYLRSLAQLRGRNAEFAEAAVRSADTMTASEALTAGVTEIVASNVDDLLAQADGRTVKLGEREVVLETAGATVTRVEPDWRNRLLSVITEPSVAYLLLLVGLYGLVFEGYSPGAIVPGVVGAISLLLALYALQVLPVNYVGVALIVLGVGLMAAELAAPSFGALGIGGVVALIAGSIILFDTDVPGFGVPGRLIVGIGVTSALGFIGVLYLAVRARGRPVVTGTDELVGQTATVIEDFQGRGRVHVRGEDWQAIAEVPLQKGQHVRVQAVEGLALRVAPAE